MTGDKPQKVKMMSTSRIEKVAFAAMMALGMGVSTAPCAQTVGGTGPNNVYIEQLGDSNTITIQQVGGNNNIGGVGGTAWSAPSSSNYGTVNGSSNVVTMTQTGTGNMGQYAMWGNSNTYTSTVTGDGNKTKLTIGDVGNPTNPRNTVSETIVGDTNTLVTNLRGSDINSTTTVTGNTNQVISDLLSSRGSSNISITGANNQVQAQQMDSAGGSGHVLVSTISGDYNSIITQQQGFSDTTVNMNTIGSHNTITVRTSNSSIVSPLTATPR